jgi:glutathione synthase/RimK-type ligase-like ATP-grasp enzyme
MHMARLSRYGFAVPEWIAGNDPALVRPFLSTCPDGAVVKASSGLRSHVRLADEDYLSRLAEGTTPSVVQRFVRGYEVRVHVVGPRVFGTRIDASSVDYRFDAEHVRYEREEVPESIARLCVESAARDGLALAGLDFRVDRDGAWWCLEMNPVPTFLPYEASSGAAIGDAVLDYVLDADGVTTARSPLAALVQDAGA